MSKENPAQNHDDIYQVVARYCAYQERCRKEAADKLRSLDIAEPEAATLLRRLEQENFINDERFAMMFAGGKFRLKKWGRNKIRYALQLKHIPPSLIREALGTIDEKSYQATIEKLARQKFTLLARENMPQRKIKTVRFLVQRGFEPALSQKAVAKISAASTT